MPAQGPGPQGPPGQGPRQLPPARGPAPGGAPPGAGPRPGGAPPGGRPPQGAGANIAAIRGVAAMSNALMDEVSKAIIGKRNVLEHVLMAILADGHILFEDFPGTAKSLMVMTFAQALGCKYRRI